MDLDPTVVSSKLAQLRSTLKSCCSLACFSWLTLAVVMYCRSQYVGLESHKKRAEWLKQKFEQISRSNLPHSNTIRYDYVIEMRGFEEKKVCLKAFDFAYGISPATHKYHSARLRGGHKPRRSLKKIAKQRRKGTTAGEMYFAEWLKQYAADNGDQLPFAEKE